MFTLDNPSLTYITKRPHTMPIDESLSGRGTDEDHHTYDDLNTYSFLQTHRIKIWIRFDFDQSRGCSYNIPGFTYVTRCFIGLLDRDNSSYNNLAKIHHSICIPNPRGTRWVYEVNGMKSHCTFCLCTANVAFSWFQWNMFWIDMVFLDIKTYIY